MNLSKNRDSTWEAFRAQMPVARSLAYFDHAAVSPIPLPAYLAITEWAAEASFLGDAVWPKWNRRAGCLREVAASLIGADASEIAIVPNTTAGINLVADGIDWQPGDNVVMPAGEFPSNLFPWKLLEQRGVDVREVPLLEGDAVDLDGIDDACDSRTRIVTASWVGFASGYRIDVAKLGEIAHRHGALFFLDAIQGMGVFPLDVRACGVDFLAADGHKWMLGPEGVGIFFVDQQRLDSLRPQQVGWKSVKSPFNYSAPSLDLVEMAQRFEGGSQNLAGIAALLASLELLVEHGAGSDSTRLADRVIQTSDEMVRQLEGIGATIHSLRDRDCASGIVSFSIDHSSPESLRNRLVQRGIIVSCRGGRLRCAVHAYNNVDDIDRLIEALKIEID